MSLAVDVLLAGGLVGLAAMALFARDLFAAVILFVSQGLLLALTWARLDAPDVAMAEAAIGAGLTGALLLAALRRLRAVSTRAGADHGTG